MARGASSAAPPAVRRKGKLRRRSDSGHPDLRTQTATQLVTCVESLFSASLILIHGLVHFHCEVTKPSSFAIFG
jgi:hypothetical protein